MLYQVLNLRQVYTRTLESDMADILAAAQQQYPAVEIGSYPKFDNTKMVYVGLTFEGEDYTEVCLRVRCRVLLCVRLRLRLHVCFCY